jgi:hypothetical protein
MLHIAREGKKEIVMDFIASPTISADLPQEETVEKDNDPKDAETETEEDRETEIRLENSEEHQEEI